MQIVSGGQHCFGRAFGRVFGILASEVQKRAAPHGYSGMRENKILSSKNCAKFKLSLKHSSSLETLSNKCLTRGSLSTLNTRCSGAAKQHYIQLGEKGSEVVMDIYLTVGF